jgi:hypothetical protein
MVELTNLSYIQGGSNMTGRNCDLFTHKSSRSYLNHLVHCTRTYIRGYAVAQLVEALRYKPEGGGGSIPDGITGIFQ